MNVELLVVPGCANEQAAATLLRTALDQAGLGDLHVTTTVVADQDTAERIGFTGSPTFMLDGVDLFADPGRPAGLSCRIYRGADGAAGVPPLDDLRRALLDRVRTTATGTRSSDRRPHRWTTTP